MPHRIGHGFHRSYAKQLFRRFLLRHRAVNLYGDTAGTGHTHQHLEGRFLALQLRFHPQTGDILLPQGHRRLLAAVLLYQITSGGQQRLSQLVVDAGLGFQAFPGTGQFFYIFSVFSKAQI